MIIAAFDRQQWITLLVVRHDSDTRPEVVIKEESRVALTVSGRSADTFSDPALCITHALRTSRVQGHHLVMLVVFFLACRQDLELVECTCG